MTRRNTVAVVASVALASLGATTTLAFGDPPVTGEPATVYRDQQTVTVNARTHGHSGGYWYMRMRQTRVHLRASVLQQHSLSRRLATETRASRQAARDYADDYGIRGSGFLCIHRYEGPWNAATGNGYYGGVQMDRSFMGTYGAPFLRAWGSADHWPAYIQIAVAEAARLSGRGYGPWPNTARTCGLL